jgi:hypothetical protein
VGECTTAIPRGDAFVPSQCAATAQDLDDLLMRDVAFIAIAKEQVMNIGSVY